MARSSRSTAPADFDDAVAAADWAELALLSRSRRRMSRSDLRGAVREASFLPEDELDLAVDFIFREVRRRVSSGGDAYPFTFEGGSMSLRPGPSALAYVFMLCLSRSFLLREERRFQEVDRLFDSLVIDALRAYLGPHAETVRFGWPVSDGRPPDFYTALDWLSARMGLDRGPSKATPDRKDGGVDIVAWMPFVDGGTGFLTLLTQCTIQMDWAPKARDAVADVWAGWVDFGRMPLTCLAVPHVVPRTFDKWDEIRRTVHVLLERVRLTALLRDRALSKSSEINAWVRREIARLADA